MTNHLNRPERGMGKLLLAAGVLACLCGPAPKAQEPAKSGTAGSDAAYSQYLVTQFEKAEFHTGYRPGDPIAAVDYVRKWIDWKDSDTGRKASPLLIRVLGADDSYRKYARDVITELSRLSDLPVVEPPLDSDVVPNFVISLVKPDRVEELLVLWNVPADQRKEFVKLPCVGLNGHTNGTIVISFIMIKNTLDETQTKHCLIEEATRALGFRAPDFEEPSVFSGEKTGIIQLSRDDKILVRALYDKRITVAMSARDAMALVPTIISELVERMRTAGDEALYQH